MYSSATADSASILAAAGVPTDEGRVLHRYSFVGLLLRIAVAKFAPEAECAPAWALERLVCEHVAKHSLPTARVDRDVFRTSKLYCADVEAVLKRHMGSLRALYAHYASSDADADLKSRGESLSMAEWMRMLTDAELIDSVRLTKKEGALAFLWAQMFVADELKRREKMIHLPFEGFLEALARITLFKPLPTTKQLADAKCKNARDFFALQAEDRILDDYLGANALDWKVEETGGRALHDSLDKLIGLLAAPFDVDGMGKLVRREGDGSASGGSSPEKGRPGERARRRVSMARGAR